MKKRLQASIVYGNDERLQSFFVRIKKGSSGRSLAARTHDPFGQRISGEADEYGRVHSGRRRQQRKNHGRSQNESGHAEQRLPDMRRALAGQEYDRRRHGIQSESGQRQLGEIADRQLVVESVMDHIGHDAKRHERQQMSVDDGLARAFAVFAGDMLRRFEVMPPD